MADIDPGGIQVTQGVDPGFFSAGDSNGALQLARSLSGVSDDANQLMGHVADQLQQRAAAKAHADALANNGQALADAVRAGKIEATQNPWYIRAYNHDSAMIRGQASVTALVDQSQTWAERSDPVAYQARFDKELGALAHQESAHSVDAQTGFEAAATPLYKQAIAANQEYNVERIQQEHQKNVSTLMTTAIQEAAKANGGKLTPELAQKALEPYVTQWTSTGGTTPQARSMMLNSIIGAAANTGNTSLLDVLNQDFDGHGALANMTGPNGQPVAEDLMRSRYYIDRLANTEMTTEAKQRAAAIAKEGQAGLDWVMANHGFDLLRGRVSEGQLLDEMQKQGISPQGAAEALRQLHAEVQGASSLATSLVGLRDSDPDNQISVAKLYERAARYGTSKELDSDVNEAIRTGLLTKQDADKIDTMAANRSAHLEDKAESRAQHTDSESRAQQRWQAEQAKQHVDYAVGAIVDARTAVNDRSYLNNPQKRARLLTAGRAAQGHWLLLHPGDYSGANEAADAAIVNEARRSAGQTQPAGAKGGNPNGASF